MSPCEMTINVPVREKRGVLITGKRNLVLCGRTVNISVEQSIWIKHDRK